MAAVINLWWRITNKSWPHKPRKSCPRDSYLCFVQPKPVAKLTSRIQTGHTRRSTAAGLQPSAWSSYPWWRSSFSFTMPCTGTRRPTGPSPRYSSTILTRDRKRGVSWRTCWYTLGKFKIYFLKVHYRFNFTWLEYLKISYVLNIVL